MSAPARVIRAHFQKVARHLRDDPAFPWRYCCRCITNEAMGIPTIAPNVATALCYGRNAPFATIGEIPPHILAEAEVGVSEALAVGKRIPADGAALGRALGMTQELREQLKVWLIWPAGATRDDLAARREARAAERRAKDRIRKEQQRRAKGMAERREYEGRSLAAQARALGVKPDTLRARLRRATAHVTPDVASVSAEHILSSADRPATKRDTIAEQARAMGISPATLRKRIQRERQRRQEASDVTLATSALESAEPVSSVMDVGGDGGCPSGAPTSPVASIIIPEQASAKTAVAGAPSSARPAPAASSSEKGRAARYIIGPAGQRPPLPPQPHMPASIPGRNILQAIGVENGALVIRLAHEAVLTMLRARAPDGDPAGNALRMVVVWDEQRRAMRRELVSRGASFVDCLHATAAFAAITERETAEASRFDGLSFGPSLSETSVVAMQ